MGSKTGINNLNNSATPTGQVSFWASTDDGEKVLLGVASAERGAKLANKVRKEARLAHGNSKQVRVVAVDDAEAERCRKECPNLTAMVPGQTFNSAFDASIALGFDYNMVAMALGHAKRVASAHRRQGGLDGEGPAGCFPAVTVRGVTFERVLQTAPVEGQREFAA